MLVGYILSRVCLRCSSIGYLPYFLCNVWGCMCKTGPFKLRWSRGYVYNSSYCHQQIRSINLFYCHIFRGCAIVCCRFHIYPMKSWIVSLLLLCNLMMCANDRVHYGPMIVFVCLHITVPHYHHYADISEGIGLLKLHSVQCVSNIKSILSSNFPEIYGAVCIRFTHFSSNDCENNVRYLDINITSEVWPIYHCLWLGHETMVCVVCLSIFL